MTDDSPTDDSPPRGWNVMFRPSPANVLPPVIGVVTPNVETAKYELAGFLWDGKLEPMSLEEVADSGLGPEEVGLLR